MVYKKDKRLLEFDEEIDSVDKKIEENNDEEITYDRNDLELLDEDNEDGDLELFDEASEDDDLDLFTEDEKDDLDLDSVDENSDEDAGFELDDSGMIPMLEELKALGKDEEDEGKFLDGEEIFLEEKPALNIAYEDEDYEVTRELEKISDDNNDELLEDDDVLMEDFKRSEIIEKDKLDEKKLDDYESMYDFNYLDQLDDSSDIDKQTIFAEDDFLTDTSDVKVKFYDDANRSDSTNLLEALDKIADKSELLDELERLADNTEVLDVVEEGMDDFQDYLKTMKRIADSLERIADSLEKEDK
ncbi:MAG: hypothetical protein RR561_00920 [Peptostreptococcus sp.]|uniref:hypothetical protein n=1 Tax=Peptostreptococcus sp. TaxID=1262 RepID=UPI002FCA918B